MLVSVRRTGEQQDAEQTPAPPRQLLWAPTRVSTRLPHLFHVGADTPPHIVLLRVPIQRDVPLRRMG